MTDSNTLRRRGQRGDRECELPHNGLQNRRRPLAGRWPLQEQLPAAVDAMPLAAAPGVAQRGEQRAQLFPARQPFGHIGRAVEGRSEQEPRRLAR